MRVDTESRAAREIAGGAGNRRLVVSKSHRAAGLIGKTTAGYRRTAVRSDIAVQRRRCGADARSSRGSHAGGGGG